MNQDAFTRGFLKAAAFGDQINDTLSGVTPQLSQLNVNAGGIDAKLRQLLGLGEKSLAAVGGAGVGAGLGYLTGGQDEAKAKRRAVIGALLGGGTGLGLSNM